MTSPTTPSDRRTVHGGTRPRREATGRLPAHAISRSESPCLAQLGQGVANDEWVGRAAPVETYPDYVATSDIVSFDVYPVSGMRKEDGENYLWYVAKGVERLRAWAAPEGIVWNIIETTRINSERGPTPAQVETQVWMSLIHGSRGIVYFAHEWNPCRPRSTPLRRRRHARCRCSHQRADSSAGPRAQCAHATDWGSVTIGPGDGPLAVLAKRFAEDLYVFAVAMRPSKPLRASPRQGSLQIGPLKSWARIERSSATPDSFPTNLPPTRFIAIAFPATLPPAKLCLFRKQVLLGFMKYIEEANYVPS